MSVNDIKVVKSPGSTRKARVQDRTTSLEQATMKAGEPIKVDIAYSNYVILLETGDPEIGTDQFVGIARKTSTETSALSGVVEFITLLPVQTVLRADASDSTAIDTDAELLAIFNDWVCFDLSATTCAFTIDENEGSDVSVHGLKIIDGNIGDGTLDVIVSAAVTEGAPKDLTGEV